MSQRDPLDRHTGSQMEAVRFLALKKQAEDKVLLVSPPYADESAQRAFLSGYESALRDIAKGWLKP